MREKKIVEDLVDSREYRNVDYFAKLHQVSARTISNDIKYLTSISKAYGFEILLKRKEGYYLKVFDRNKLNHYLEHQNDTTNMFKNRVIIILTKLLLHNEYQTQDDLAMDLQVSKSMIKLDMIKVEERLHDYHLTLERKAHYGIQLQGAYTDRKQMLLDLMDEEDYSEQHIHTLVDNDSMKQVDEELIYQLRRYEFSTNYVEMVKLDRFLKVMIALCKSGIHNEETISLNASPYIDIANHLKEKLIALGNIALNDAEVADIAEYLRYKTKPKKVCLEYDKRLKSDILAFLKQADEDYQAAFLKDADFIQSLFAHVSLLVDRLHQSISFDNPLVKEISAKYPEIFNISIKFAEMLETHYQVKATQDEIGFIATHFAAHMEKENRNKLRSFNKIAIVCSSGGGSAFLIKLKIETLFSDADVQTFSFMEMEDLKQFQPDIIFTIKELEETFNVPIVLIKELLNDEDIQKIKHMFEFCGVEKKENVDFKSFHSMFHKNAFWIFDKGTYQDILQDMAHRLEALGYANTGYADNVRKREEVLSTVYDNGIAVPHPIEMCSDRNMLGVGIIKHDLQQDQKAVHIIFLVNLQKGNLELHQNISRVLFEVIEDEKLAERIHHSSSYEDFMKNINILNF